MPASNSPSELVLAERHFRTTLILSSSVAFVQTSHPLLLRYDAGWVLDKANLANFLFYLVLLAMVATKAAGLLAFVSYCWLALKIKI
jgi:hypothetical protein